jgi:hypothetical protein
MIQTPDCPAHSLVTILTLLRSHQLKPPYVSGDHMIGYHEILNKQGHPDTHGIAYSLRGYAAKQISPL